jgi:hypothetical protein
MNRFSFPIIVLGSLLLAGCTAQKQPVAHAVARSVATQAEDRHFVTDPTTEKARIEIITSKRHVGLGVNVQPAACNAVSASYFISGTSASEMQSASAIPLP